MTIENALTGLLTVKSQVPEEAMTASVLGCEREGHGIRVSENGLVLTIGYVISEASSIWLIDSDKQAVEGHVVGYDQASGFGLVQALGRLSGSVLELGDSDEVVVGRQMVLAGAGGATSAVDVSIVEVREFAGYWEYLIAGAIFSEPAHPEWGGTALLDSEGRVYGVGSLILQAEDDTEPARNMIIPINKFNAVRDDLITSGRSSVPPRPWLGWYVQDSAQGPTVIGLVSNGPSNTAGIKPGDRVVAINGRRISSLSSLYKEIWTAGEAGITVDVAISRDADIRIVAVESIDRSSMMWRSALH